MPPANLFSFRGDCLLLHLLPWRKENRWFQTRPCGYASGKQQENHGLKIIIDHSLVDEMAQKSFKLAWIYCFRLHDFAGDCIIWWRNATKVPDPDLCRWIFFQWWPKRNKNVFGAMVCWLWSNRIVMNAWNSTVRDVKMEDHIIIHSDQWSKWLFFVRSAFGHGDGGACRDAPAIRSVKAFRAQPADTSKTLIGYLRIVSNL